MTKIFGYEFEQIKRAQQGGRLSDPVIPKDDSHYLPHDKQLLEQYGENKLREMGYLGVIDRLERHGVLKSNDQHNRSREAASG